MKCSNCGNEIPNGNICSYCGHSNTIISNTNFNSNSSNLIKDSIIEDKSSTLAGFIGFFFVSAGVVLYFLLRRSKPLLAKSFKTGIIVNLVISLVFVGFYIFILGFGFIALISYILITI